MFGRLQEYAENDILSSNEYDLYGIRFDNAKLEHSTITITTFQEMQNFYITFKGIDVDNYGFLNWEKVAAKEEIGYENVGAIVLDLNEEEIIKAKDHEQVDDFYITWIEFWQENMIFGMVWDLQCITNFSLLNSQSYGSKTVLYPNPTPPYKWPHKVSPPFQRPRRVPNPPEESSEWFCFACCCPTWLTENQQRGNAYTTLTSSLVKYELL